MKKIFIGIIIIFNIFVLSSVTYGDTQKYYTDAQKVFLKEVYEHITDRDTSFDVIYKGDSGNWDIDDIYYILSAIDSPATNDDYDYLRGNISQIQCEYMPYGINVTKYHFTFNWFENKEQTKVVDEKVKTIINDNNVKNMNDYDKVKFVHDYIVENVRYDKNKEKFSAYEGLINKETVCQGYALLTYRMLVQAGVKCRYVVGEYIPKGEDSGENHAWNIVKLGGKWYYMDSTWDACAYEQVPNDINKYLYFLKGSDSFNEEHVIDVNENGEDITNLYNISKVDYNGYLGSGSLVDTGDDDKAVSAYDFFKLTDDGTLSSDNKVVSFINRILAFIMDNLVKACMVVVVIFIFARLMKRRKV